MCKSTIHPYRLFLAMILTATAGWSGESATPANAGGGSPAAESILFEELPIVEAASLHAQTLEEAPANVTIITEQDIRLYGYLTLGEALSNVRGFYMTDDRVYQHSGLRGFSLPGDYDTRVLLMINGHYMPDNIFKFSGLLGQDFPIDMDLIQRIEIIRGPTSALYGSAGIFATINVVTKSPVDHALSRVSTEIGRGWVCT